MKFTYRYCGLSYQFYTIYIHADGLISGDTNSLAAFICQMDSDIYSFQFHHHLEL